MIKKMPVPSPIMQVSPYEAILKINEIIDTINNPISSQDNTPKVERTNWKCNKCEKFCSISTNSNTSPMLCVYSEKYVNWTKD